MWGRRIFYTFSVTAYSLQILNQILISTLVEKPHHLHYTTIQLFINYSLLTIIQSVILILLIKSLGRIQRLGKFSRKNIIIQFALFLMSFAGCMGLCAQILLSNNYQFDDKDDRIQPFLTPLLIASVYNPLEILPISFMLYS